MKNLLFCLSLLLLTASTFAMPFSATFKAPCVIDEPCTIATIAK